VAFHLGSDEDGAKKENIMGYGVAVFLLALGLILALASRTPSKEST